MGGSDVAVSPRSCHRASDSTGAGRRGSSVAGVVRVVVVSSEVAMSTRCVVFEVMIGVVVGCVHVACSRRVCSKSVAVVAGGNVADEQDFVGSLDHEPDTGSGACGIVTDLVVVGASEESVREPVGCTDDAIPEKSVVVGALEREPLPHCASSSLAERRSQPEQRQHLGPSVIDMITAATSCTVRRANGRRRRAQQGAARQVETV